MKTVEIQQQITALKGMIREWGETKHPDDWRTILVGLEGLVQVSVTAFEPVKVHVPVEVKVDVDVPRQVITNVEVEKLVILYKDVIVEVPTIVEVPIFTSAVSEHDAA